MDALLKVLEWTVGLAVFGWFFWLRLQRREGTLAGLIAKLLATAALLGIFAGVIVPFLRRASSESMAAGYVIAMVGAGGTGVCFILLGVIWRHELTDWIASPIAKIFDGGHEELKPQPFYAHAEARRMAGDIPGAIAAVRAELEKFPNDFDGRMRLAALLAEHSEDLPGAIRVIEEALQLAELAPGQIAYALNTAADWQLKFGRDSESARLAIERITILLPGTEAALHAQQRLANHTSQEMLAHEDDHSPVAIPEFERKLGLKRRKPVAPEKPDINAVERRLRDRLAKNRNDWVAREELARLYVEQFEFFERGLQELEILISAPGQPKQEMVRWLHQKADWQVKLLNDVEAGRTTLKRIQALFPNSAAAHRAATAMNYLPPVSRFERKKPGGEPGGAEA